MFQIVIEFLTNVFQSCAVTYFLIKCLGVKSNEKKPILEYITGITVTLVYLEILNKITYFESIGVFAYLIISMFFSVFLLKGSITEKIFYNLLMIACIVFSSFLGTGVVGMITGLDYLKVILHGSANRYAAIILVQIFLCILFALIIKLKKRLLVSDSKYMKIFFLIPILSVIICCFILYRENQNYTVHVVYTLLSIIGIFAVDITSLVLLTMEHKIYREKMSERMLIDAYKQKEKDVEEIKAIKQESDKSRHEITKIFTIAAELLNSGQNEKAAEFINKFISDRKMPQESYIYCDNIILNYLLNRKIGQCNENDIYVKCFINGHVDGIEDVDMYILFANLIDNAIESCLLAENKQISLTVYANDESVELEIGNSTKGNILADNPEMNTTKADKELHGYGLQNIRDVVLRYHGSIRYSMMNENFIICKIKLKKINHI